MLRQRVITALILVAVFLIALFALPPLGFQFFVLSIFGVAAWECSTLAGLSQPIARAFYSCALLAGVIAGWQYLPHVDGLRSFFVLAAIWWAVALLWVQGYPSSAVFWQSRVARMIIGALTLIPAGVAVLTIHGFANGQWLVLALLLLVAAADTGAYFSGKAFGKRKLAPNVSPGKSWEGAIGGLVLVSLMALVYGAFDGNPWFMGLLIALPAAAVSVLGDLLESMLKRHCGVKDSGSILPGHGGVLDRIDGITAAAPVFALALIATGWVL